MKEFEYVKSNELAGVYVQGSTPPVMADESVTVGSLTYLLIYHLLKVLH